MGKPVFTQGERVHTKLAAEIRPIVPGPGLVAAQPLCHRSAVLSASTRHCCWTGAPAVDRARVLATWTTVVSNISAQFSPAPCVSHEVDNMPVNRAASVGQGGNVGLILTGPRSLILCFIGNGSAPWCTQWSKPITIGVYGCPVAQHANELTAVAPRCAQVRPCFDFGGITLAWDTGARARTS